MPGFAVEYPLMDLQALTRPCWESSNTLVVAFSGGMDSVALAHALHATMAAHHTLVLCHINHGLQSPEITQQWELLAQQWPASYGTDRGQVKVDIRHVHVPLKNSIEAQARTARYDALGQCVQDHGAQGLLLAHHLRDLSETFLLQAARGRGVHGLRSMSSRMLAHHGDGTYWKWRPWLHVDRAVMQDYVRAHRLEWVEDPSNVDTHYRRNFLRHDVLPAWRQQQSHLDQNIALAAQSCQDAAHALDFVADQDLALWAHGHTLTLPAPNSLPPWRIRHAIRRWAQTQSEIPWTPTMLQQVVAAWSKDVQERSPGWSQGPHRWTMRDEAGVRVLEYTSVAPVVQVQTEAPTWVIEKPGDALPWKGHTWEGPVPVTLRAYLPGNRPEGAAMSRGVGRPVRPLKKQYQTVGKDITDRSQDLGWYLDKTFLYSPMLGVNYQPHVHAWMKADPQVAPGMNVEPFA